MTVQSPHTFRIVRVSADTLHVYNHLCQSYEGEFSAITAKLPGPDGIFPLDTHISMQDDGAVQGWLLYEGEHPIGFAAVRHEGHEGHEGHEMCEFYIVPARRRCGAGTYFAHALFTAHPGAWEIKQLPDAVQATHFSANHCPFHAARSGRQHGRRLLERGGAPAFYIPTAPRTTLELIS